MLIALTIVAVIVAVGAVVAAYAYWVEPFSPTVSRTRIEVLPPGSAFAGFKVLHLSDFHLRKETSPKLVEGIAALASQFGDDDIDLTCITGDMIEADSGLPLLEKLMPTLNRLGAKNGTVAILGNHDYDHYPLSNLFLLRYVFNYKNDTARLISTLEKANVRVLRNQKYILERRGERLVVIGLDDFISGRHCLQFCFEGVRATDTVLLLTHSPDVVSYLLDRKVDLLLAGHTHGGQMCLPVVGSIVSRSRVFRRFASGLFRVGDMFVFITKGLGIVRHAPFRFRCAPEFALLELSPKTHADREEAA